MEAEYRRKRKLLLRTNSDKRRPWSIIIYFCFFLFLVLFFHGFSIGSATFRPVLIVSQLSYLSSVSNSLQDSFNGDGFSPLRVEDRVLFPDHVLLFVSKSIPSQEGLDCVYFESKNRNSNDFGEKRSRFSLPVLSVDEYDELRSIARCPLPPVNYSAVANLQGRQRRGNDELFPVDRPVHSWDMVVYGAALDGDTVVAFVKGLNLRPDKVSDPSPYSCHFGWGDSEKESRFALTTKAISAAQEVIRCSLPVSIRKRPVKAQGIRVSIGVNTQISANHRALLGGRGRSHGLHSTLPSVAKISNANSQNWNKNKKNYELCVCSMVWNQASSLHEWIKYHSWLGVERWFIYDNNSDDDIKEVIEELNQENYNISRHVWPWIKTQEAGFSHCVLKAKNECTWVGFMDVDEFFYFPMPNSQHPVKKGLGYPGQNSLRSLVANFSSSTTYGEIRTACHSFGPSGLSNLPSQGVTVGYTCRLQSPERHKSIIRPDVLQDTLLNVVHHFRLKKGYRYLNLPQSTAVINHYKYQVWEAFRAKFFRRVATYVADWQENQNEGSKDRAPGLGTQAIEPPNWRLRFCEVWDTGLRDFVMSHLADPASGVLPWEKASL